MKHPVNMGGTRLLRRSRSCIVLRWLGTASSCAVAAGVEAKPLYKDAKAPVEARIEDLLSRMTPQDKIAQITAVWSRKAALLTAAGACLSHPQRTRKPPLAYASR